MERSNIIGGSNVYPCKGNPLTDQEFVRHIEDYGHIRTIHKMQEFRQASVHLTKKQSQLLEIEMRCALLRDRPDPCWGYIEGQGIRSRCIEGRCPHILKCNPTYTKEQAEYWRMTEEVRNQYGKPDKQKKYYLVDLVSDQEMLKYYSDPKGAGKEYPPIKDPEPKKPKESKPAGRRLVIIGYEETYFGDADNQLSPIWGYVDDSEDAGPIVTHQYGSSKENIHKNAYKLGEKPKKKKKPNVEKKVEIETVASKEEPQKVVAVPELDSAIKKTYEQGIKGKLSESYPLTEITLELIEELFGDCSVSIVLANEAEQAYVSSMFLQAGIEHDVETESGKERITLWKADSKVISLGECVIVSDDYIKQGCTLDSERSWKELQKVSAIMEMTVTGRDFFGFDTDKGKRWGCRNLYGATHLAVEVGDFELSEKVDEEQKITLMKDTKNYIILSTSSAEQLGVTNDGLWTALDSLKKADEISEFPRIISGLMLSGTDNGVEIKGIGHMKFDEY